MQSKTRQINTIQDNTRQHNKTRPDQTRHDQDKHNAITTQEQHNATGDNIRQYKTIATQDNNNNIQYETTHD